MCREYGRLKDTCRVDGEECTFEAGEKGTIRDGVICAVGVV